MSNTPARPLPINSPRSGHRVDDATQASLRDENPVSASPRPDLDRFRERFSATPPPNIPQRPFAPPTSSSPFRQSLGGPLGASPAGTPRSFVPSTRLSRPSTPRPNVGGFPQTDSPDPQVGPGTPAMQDLDELSPEEKARVLRRHLVSREERAARQDDQGDHELSSDGTPTATPGRRPSVAGPGSMHRMDTEPFPIPFNAPGGDIT